MIKQKESEIRSKRKEQREARRKLSKDNAQDLIDDLRNQNLSEVHLVSANIHALQGKQDQAVQALQRAVQYNPSHPGYALFLK